jgi:DNA-binding MarR family transcriptional regulator
VLINDAAEALATPVAAPVKNKLNGSQKVDRRRLSGEQHPHSKLTDAQRADIVKRYKNGETQRSLAREFGIAPPTVNRIIKIAA